MRKLLVLILLTVTFVPSLFAAEVAAPGPQRKIQRGFLNMALCWAELGNEVVKDKKNLNPLLPAMIPGLIRGSFNTVARALAGAYDFVTFPVAAPKEYKPVMEPEFPWEYFKEKPNKNLKVSSAPRA